MGLYGKDSCACSGKSQYSSVDAITKAELGPAYKDWNNGDVNIDIKWRESRHIPISYLGDCCENTEYEWNAYYLWREHIGVLVFFEVFTFLGLYLFYQRRNYQPCRFRKYQITMVHGLNLALTGAIIILNGVNMSFSGSCSLQLVGFFVAVPVYLVYNGYLGACLWFVYQWTRAKLQQRDDLISWYHQYRWVTSFRTYLMLTLCMYMFGAVQFALFEQLIPVYNDSTDHMISTMRCGWWSIPEEYTKAKTNDTLCACWYYEADSSLDDARLACNQTLSAYCAFPIDRPSHAEFQADCCTSAGTPEFTTVNMDPDKDCQNYFEEFIISNQSCGYTDTIPHAPTCRVCLGASRATLYSYVAECNILYLLVIGLVYATRNMRDQLAIRTEILVSFVVSLGGLWTLMASLLSDEVQHKFREAWPGYELEYFILIFMVFWGVALGVWFPVIMSYRMNANAEGGGYAPLLGLVSKTKPDSERSTSTSGLRRHSLPRHMVELEFCLSHQRARQLYEDFASKEFSIEAIMFLNAVAVLTGDTLSGSASAERTRSTVVVNPVVLQKQQQQQQHQQQLPQSLQQTHAQKRKTADEPAEQSRPMSTRILTAITGGSSAGGGGVVVGGSSSAGDASPDTPLSSPGGDDSGGSIAALAMNGDQESAALYDGAVDVYFRFMDPAAEMEVNVPFTIRDRVRAKLGIAEPPPPSRGLSIGRLSLGSNLERATASSTSSLENRRSRLAQRSQTERPRSPSRAFRPSRVSRASRLSRASSQISEGGDGEDESSPPSLPPIPPGWQECTVEDVRLLFRAAVVEVKKLIARDSWPRFTRSASYPEFQRILDVTEAMDREVTAMLLGEAEPDEENGDDDVASFQPGGELLNRTFGAHSLSREHEGEGGAAKGDGSVNADGGSGGAAYDDEEAEGIRLMDASQA